MYQTIAQVAQLLHVKPDTLARWRMHGTGPRYLKLNGKILYHQDDIAEFVRTRRFVSTGEQQYRRENGA